MADEDTKVGGIAVERLRSLIERIERLEEERKALGNDIKDIYGEAKSAGFQSPMSNILCMYKQRLRGSTHTVTVSYPSETVGQCTIERTMAQRLGAAVDLRLGIDAKGFAPTLEPTMPTAVRHWTERVEQPKKARLTAAGGCCSARSATTSRVHALGQPIRTTRGLQRSGASSLATWAA